MSLHYILSNWNVSSYNLIGIFRIDKDYCLQLIHCVYKGIDLTKLVGILKYII